MKDLAGKVAVVTGAGSGIGRGLCRAFADEGMHVVAADIDAAAAEATRAELSQRGALALAVRTDVARRAEVEALVAATQRAFGTAHLVCNNAGVGTGGDPLAASEAEWRWLLDVNLLGVVHGCQLFAPLLVAQGEGHILNTGSLGSFLPSAELSIYTTSKAAVASFTEGLREHLAPKGIGVTLLCPGPVATGLAGSDRLRPGPHEKFRGSAHVLDAVMEMGIHPDEVGRVALAGIRENAEYVFTHTEYEGLIGSRFARVLRAAGQVPG
jgi:NAD(P)-dependent dehydrogenase (short-subunit alcohol dehydrogenase family)